MELHHDNRVLSIWQENAKDMHVELTFDDLYFSTTILCEMES